MSKRILGRCGHVLVPMCREGQPFSGVTLDPLCPPNRASIPLSLHSRRRQHPLPSATSTSQTQGQSWVAVHLQSRRTRSQALNRCPSPLILFQPQPVRLIQTGDLLQHSRRWLSLQAGLCSGGGGCRSKKENWVVLVVPSAPELPVACTTHVSSLVGLASGQESC